MPGFINFVWETVIGRYVEERNQLGRPFGYYLETLIRHKFWPWMLFVIPHLWLWWKSPSDAFRRWSTLIWSVTLPYLLIISFSLQVMPKRIGFNPLDGAGGRFD